MSTRAIIESACVSVGHVLTIGMVVAFNDVLPRNGADPTGQGALFYILFALNITGGSATLSVLQVVNLVTIAYGLYFYIGRERRGSIKLMAFVVFAGAIAFPPILRYNPELVEVDPRYSFLLKEYSVAIGLTFWFLVFDLLKSQDSREEQALLSFNAWYVSLPSLSVLILALTLLFELSRAPYGMSRDGAEAFTAGVFSTVLVLGNLQVLLVAIPGYAKRIEFKFHAGMESSMDRLVTIGVCAAIVGMLAFFAAISVSFVHGVAAIYPAAAFEVAFGAWFGLPGAVASYIGLLVAGSLGGWFNPAYGLAMSVSDALLAGSMAIAVRRFGLDPEVKSLRSAISFVLVAMLAGSLPGSIIYNWLSLKFGLLSGEHSFWVAILGWNLGNLFVVSVIGLPLMRFGTPILMRMGLFRRTLW